MFRASRWGRSLQRAAADEHAAPCHDDAAPCTWPARRRRRWRGRSRLRSRRWPGRLSELPADARGVRARSTTRWSHAESATVHDFDKEQFFEGCLPIEVMAHRGRDTLRFGPMKPVGLVDPRTGRASVRGGAAAAGQSRRRPLQPRRIPDADQMGRAGARAAADSRTRARGVRAVRHGAPQHLHQRPDGAARDVADAARGRTCSSRGRCRGVEGYVESAASGSARRAQRRGAGVAARRRVVAPRTTAIGALAYYVSHADPHGLPADQHHVRHHAPRSTSRRAAGTARRRPQARDLGAGAARSRRAGVAATSEIGSAVPSRNDDRSMTRHSRRWSPTSSSSSASIATRPSTPSLAYAGDLTQFIDYVATSQKRARPTLDGRRPDHRRDPHVPGRAVSIGALSRATAARKLAAVRSFARYLRREGAIADDPAALVGTPRREQKLPAHLSMDEMSLLLETPDRTSPLGRRDQAILELFYASGIRLSELVGLDLDDVNLSGRIVRVLGKGGKERQVRSTRARRRRSARTSRIAKDSSRHARARSRRRRRRASAVEPAPAGRGKAGKRRPCFAPRAARASRCS